MKNKTRNLNSKEISLTPIEYQIWKSILASNSEVLRRTIQTLAPGKASIKQLIKEYREQLQHEETLKMILSNKTIQLLKLLK